MLKALVCLFFLADLFFVAWPLVLVFLMAAPVVLLGCLILKMLGVVVGGVLHLAVWGIALALAVGLAVLFLPLALMF